jgi:hypothetical protein
MTGDQLINRGITNSRQICQQFQQLSEIPQESPEYDAGKLRRAIHEEGLTSISSELAIMDLYEDSLPMKDLCSQSLGDQNNHSLIALFAAQAFLDIKEIMGPDIDRGFEELIYFRNSLDIDYQVSEFETDAVDALAAIKASMDEDGMQVLRLRLWHSMTAEERSCLEEVFSPSASFKLLKEHPLMCGVALFYMRVALQWAGLSDANGNISILSCAHLYNAMQKTKVLPRQWIDLENILSSHRDGELFIGSRPEAPAAIYRQWLIVNGMSAALFSKDVTQRLERNPNSVGAEMQKRFNKDSRILKTPTPLARAFLENYGEPGLSQTERFGALRPNVNLAFSFHIKNLIQNGDVKAAQFSGLEQTLGTSSIANKVEMFLSICVHAESQMLAFNYARMNQRCYRYLESLLPMFPELEQKGREESNVGNIAVLVGRLLSQKARCEIPAIILQDVAKKMSDLIERKGSFETKMVEASLKYVPIMRI